MKLSFVNYEEIKNEVAYLFTSFNVKTLPTNPMELATKIGIELVPYSHLSQRKLLLFFISKQKNMVKSFITMMQ